MSNNRNHAVANESHKMVGQSLFMSLVVLAVIGVVISNISPSDAHGYWIFLLVVFAGTAIYCGRKQESVDGDPIGGLVLKQVIHWGAALVAILCVYTLLHTGRINYEEAGLIILLILALATFIAGIQVGWRFYVLGILLALTTVIAAYIEQFMWVILLLAVAIVAVTFYGSKHKAAE